MPLYSSHPSVSILHSISCHCRGQYDPTFGNTFPLHTSHPSLFSQRFAFLPISHTAIYPIAHMSSNTTPNRGLLERREHPQLNPLDLSALHGTTTHAVQRVVATADVLYQETDDRLNEEEMKTQNHSATLAYLRELPVVNPSEIDQASIDCPICHEPFTTTPDGKGPVRMTCCRKIFDIECITTWLSSLIARGRCPNCRMELFTPARRLSSTMHQQRFSEHIESLLRDGVPMENTIRASDIQTSQPTVIWQPGERRLQGLQHMPYRHGENL